MPTLGTYPTYLHTCSHLDVVMGKIITMINGPPFSDFQILGVIIWQHSLQFVCLKKGPCEEPEVDPFSVIPIVTVLQFSDTC